MKYMGSKRILLKNGLGHLLDREIKKRARFVDLFSGSAAVSWFVASRYQVPVWANDLQTFGVVLAKAVLQRTNTFDAARTYANWIKRATARRAKVRVPRVDARHRSDVLRARAWCADQRELPVTAAYGGHYFSPDQAVWIDALLQCLPKSTARMPALASLVCAANYSVASPGHTAQPLSPSPTALPFIRHAWQRNVLARLQSEVEWFAKHHAFVRGDATIGDANLMARRVRESDLVFLDPPYSAVQYSRFYHVLETITRQRQVKVSGVGRYPPRCERPESRYSRVTSAADAMEELLSTLAAQGARTIVTFPAHECSNGLSGALLVEIANQFFRVVEREVTSVFSTLGGNPNSKSNAVYAKRRARVPAGELVIVLHPRG